MVVPSFVRFFIIWSGGQRVGQVPKLTGEAEGTARALEQQGQDKPVELHRPCSERVSIFERRGRAEVSGSTGARQRRKWKGNLQLFLASGR
jgi:hypothetical protein